jgi:hypothetical protein
MSFRFIIRVLIYFVLAGAWQVLLCIDKKIALTYNRNPDSERKPRIISEGTRECFIG